jgi:hypothetical protein
MITYTPIKGPGSRAMAQKFLDRHFDEFNEWDVYCPCISDDCREQYCASWVKAEVYCRNGLSRTEKVMFDIKPGHCQNPMITGTIKTT